MGILKANVNNDDREKREYLEQIWLAWQEWQSAINLFENAFEPEMVEYAVFNIEARRRQYMFMVKYARDHLKLDADILMRKENNRLMHL